MPQSLFNYSQKRNARIKPGEHNAIHLCQRSMLGAKHFAANAALQSFIIQDN